MLEELGLADEIPVASLAKRFEEVYVPGEADPIRLPRQSEALYLLQRIRDEAHRFAITFHRELRGKRMTTSVLDGISGLGEVRKKRLVKELGGVRAVKAAQPRGPPGAPWLPDAVAQAVHEKIHRPTALSIVTQRNTSGQMPAQTSSADSGPEVADPQAIGAGLRRTEHQQHHAEAPDRHDQVGGAGEGRQRDRSQHLPATAQRDEEGDGDRRLDEHAPRT